MKDRYVWLSLLTLPSIFSMIGAYLCAFFGAVFGMLLGGGISILIASIPDNHLMMKSNRISYWEYVKERWIDIFTWFRSVAPIFLWAGFMVPLGIGITAWPFNYDLALYSGCIGIIWFVFSIGFLLISSEKDKYEDWKDNYSFNHRHQTNSKDETQGEKE